MRSIGIILRKIQDVNIIFSISYDSRILLITLYYFLSVQHVHNGWKTNQVIKDYMTSTLKC